MTSSARPQRVLLKLVLVLLGFSLAPFALAQSDPSTMSDATFFAKLNLSYPGLGPATTTGTVAYHVSRSEWTQAKAALVTYFRNRTNVNILPLADPDLTQLANLRNHIIELRISSVRHIADLDDSWNISTNPKTAVYDPVAIGNPDWATPPPMQLGGGNYEAQVSGQWIELVSRFQFMRHIVANYVNSGYPSSLDGDIDNMLAIIADYIVDVGNTNPGFGDGLQVAERAKAWASYFPYFLHSSSADANRITGLLKHLWQITDYTANPVNFIGHFDNRGMKQLEALAMLGVYFPEFNDADDWILAAQTRGGISVPSNFHPNGVLAEPAIGYHRGQTGDLIGMQDLALMNGSQAFSDDVLRLIHPALTYVGDTIFPNGKQPLVGDSDSNVPLDEVTDMANTTTVLGLARNDILHIVGAGLGGYDAPGHTSSLYGQGAAIMRSGWTDGSMVAYIDNQPAASHSHFDNLSVNLYAFGTSMLINGGRMGYDPSGIDADYYTDEVDANNTVEIDNRPTRTFGEKIEKWVHQEAAAGYDYFEGSYQDTLASGLIVTEDAQASRQNPTTKAPSDPTMALVNDSTGKDVVAFYQIRCGTIAPTVTSTEFRVYAENAKNAAVTVTVYGLYSVTSATDYWNDHTITWDTAPGLAAGDSLPDGTAGTDYVQLGTLTIPALSTGSWVSLTGSTLNSYIQHEAVSTDGKMTLLIVAPSNTTVADGIKLYTKESEHRPSLELSTSSGNWTDVTTHRRKVWFDRSNLMIVSDALTGNSLQSHDYLQFWNLNPITDGAPTASGGKATAVFKTSATGSVTSAIQVMNPDVSATLETGSVVFDGTVYTGSTGNKRVAFRRTGTGAKQFDTVIYATDQTASGSPSAMNVTRVALGISQSQASSLKIALSSENVWYYVRHDTSITPPSFDGWTWDGDLAVIRKTTGGTLTRINLKGGTLLKEGTTTRVESPTTIEDLTVDFSTSSQIKLYSSRPLSQQLKITPPAAVTAVYYNGELVAHTVASGVYTVEQKLLLTADFNTGTARAWMADSSTWRVDDINGNGVYTQRSTTEDKTITVAGQLSWTDYAAQTDVMINQNSTVSSSIGLMARYQSWDNHYGFVYDPATTPSSSQLKIYKRYKPTGGSVTYTELASTNFVMYPGSWYRLKARVTGDVLQLFVNDVLKVSYTDSSATKHTSGEIGLLVDEADVSFDNVFVTGGTSLTANSPEAGRRQDFVADRNSFVGLNSPRTSLFSHFYGGDRVPTLINGTIENTVRRAFLAVANGSGVEDRISFVHFDFNGFSGTIQKAEVHLWGSTIDYLQTGASSAQVDVYKISESAWNDRSMTWDNTTAYHASGDATPASGLDYVTTLTVFGLQEYLIDVTSKVSSLPAGQRVVSLMLVPKNSSTPRVEFSSTLYAKPPFLRVENP